MNVLILCDSRFGNTWRIADSMASALGARHRVTLRTVDDGLGSVAGVDVLLVGGPTHAHGLSWSLKEALAEIPAGSLRATRVATFDTRFQMSPTLTGSAAVAASKALEWVGADVVAPPESFFVTRDDPPDLLPGEIERAKTWAQAVVG